MENLSNEPKPINPVLSLVIFIFSLLLGFYLIGPIVGVFIAMPFFDGSLLTLAEQLTAGSMLPEMRMPMLVVQASASGVGLILVPMLAYTFIAKNSVGRLYVKSSWLGYALAVVAVLVFVFPNSLIIEWNANLKFTGAFWTWARNLEDKGEEFTKFMTDFQSPSDFLFLFFVIAILPAIGEEFCFRGWLQPALQKVTGNAHVAIWLSAILFSAFHLQFFGFVPRMLLGAMFGYFMYWSGNLWLAIVAHMVNNGFSVLMLYLYKLKVIDLDPNSPESLPLMAVIPFTILFVFLIVLIKKNITHPNEVVQTIQ